MAENKMEMDPEVLRTTARKVETSAGDVRKELKRFTSVIEGLSSTWSSEVKDRFCKITRRTGRLFGNGRAVHRSGRRTPGDRR